MILASLDDWDFDDSNNTDYPVATTSLVASQRDYTFPTSLKILTIKRVDVSYDGTNYYEATPFDSSAPTFGLGNDSLTDANFSTSKPFYDLKANAIWLYPAATANTGTLRIEFYRDISEFASTDTTKTPGFDTPFHRLLSLGAAYDYAMARGLETAPNIGTQLADMEIRMKQYYGKKDMDSHIALNSAYISYN